MKIASRVFIILSLIRSIFISIVGLIILILGMAYIASYAPGTTSSVFSSVPAWSWLAYGIYCLVVTIGSLVATGGRSKTAVIVWAIFLLPVTLLGAIFMFCIRSEDLR